MTSQRGKTPLDTEETTVANTPATTTGTEIEEFDPSDSVFPVLFSGQGEGSALEVIKDNLGDDGFSPTDLDRLKVPAGGGRSWDIPDEEPATSVEGIIVHRQPTRSFWFAARGEGGEDDGPPDCYSPEAEFGRGVFGLPETRPEGADLTTNPTGACETCPMNVFGSSDRGSGEGKACKEQLQVFLLQEDSVLPIQVSLPPTSLRPFRKYMTRLASKNKSHFAVVTRLGLTVQKGGGQTYSVVEPSRARDLTPTEATAARRYGSMIRGFIEAAMLRREGIGDGTPTTTAEPVSEDSAPVDA